MLHTVFDGERVAADERFDAWQDLCDRTLVPTVLAGSGA